MHAGLCCFLDSDPIGLSARAMRKKYLYIVSPALEDDTILNQVSLPQSLLFFVGHYIYMSDLTNCFVWSCYSDHTSTSTSTSTPTPTPASTSSSTSSIPELVAPQQYPKCALKVPTFQSSTLQKTCQIYKAGLLSLREVHVGLGMSLSCPLIPIILI